MDECIRVMKIRDVMARRIWDSRGKPTVEVEVINEDGTSGIGIAPAGASRGTREAVELRDGGHRFNGLDVQQAIAGVERVYDRHHYEEEKADALKRLAALIEKIVSPPQGNVIEMRGSK